MFEITERGKRINGRTSDTNIRVEYDFADIQLATN